MFLFAMLAPDGRWAESTLLLVQSVVLICAFWTSGLKHTRTRVGPALLPLSVLAAAANVAVGGKASTATVALLTSLLTIVIASVIAVGISDQDEVNRQSVRGAIAVYLLIGLLFVFLYGAVAAIGAGTLFAQGTDGTRSLRTYFSFVTLATLGYGDYTPSGTVGHTLAVMEALVGQLYLVTIVAVLVTGLRRR